MGRVIKKALLQVGDFHFLCPFRSSATAVSLYIAYFRSYGANSQLFPTLLLHLSPFNTLGSALRQEGALRPNPPIPHQIDVEMHLLSFPPQMASLVLISFISQQ